MVMGDIEINRQLDACTVLFRTCLSIGGKGREGVLRNEPVRKATACVRDDTEWEMRVVIGDL